VPFTSVVIDLDVPGYKDELLKVSNAGTVPVLQIKEEVIPDSLAIAEFCAQAVPNLWPKDADMRAEAERVVKLMHTGFPAIRAEAPMNLRRRTEGPLPADCLGEAHHIRTVPDFPKPGIMYRDITTLLSHPKALAESVRQLAAPWRAAGIDAVAGIDARGFIFGTAVAVELGVGFVPIRKKGKLPFETYEQDYALEYGSDTLQIHADAVVAKDRVLLIDDLIATGGTAAAAIALLNRTGCEIVGATFLIDLPDLGGKAKVEAMGVSWSALMEFAGH